MRLATLPLFRQSLFGPEEVDKIYVGDLIWRLKERDLGAIETGQHQKSDEQQTQNSPLDNALTVQARSSVALTGNGLAPLQECLPV